MVNKDTQTDEGTFAKQGETQTLSQLDIPNYIITKHSHKTFDWAFESMQNLPLFVNAMTKTICHSDGSVIHNDTSEDMLANLKQVVEDLIKGISGEHPTAHIRILLVLAKIENENFNQPVLNWGRSLIVDSVPSPNPLGIIIIRDTALNALTLFTSQAFPTAPNQFQFNISMVLSSPEEPFKF